MKEDTRQRHMMAYDVEQRFITTCGRFAGAIVSKIRDILTMYYYRTCLCWRAFYNGPKLACLRRKSQQPLDMLASFPIGLEDSNLYYYLYLRDSRTVFKLISTDSQYRQHLCRSRQHNMCTPYTLYVGGSKALVLPSYPFYHLYIYLFAHVIVYQSISYISIAYSAHSDVAPSQR
jgi:hypothetical protein